MALVVRQVLSIVIKMPTKAVGKKLKSSVKNGAGKNARQKKKSPPKKPPVKTRSSAVSPANKSSAKAGTKRGSQVEGPGARREKRSKTRPLTTADIPDIVSAVVRGMPQSAEAAPSSSTRQRGASRHKQKSTGQPSQSTRRRVTRTTPAPETDDSSNEGDADHEDFGKLCSSACYVRVMFRFTK